MEYVNADSIAAGISGFQPQTVAFDAGRTMLKRLHALAEQRLSFAFETTLASRTWAPWILSLREKGYAFNLVFVWLVTAEIAGQRVQERARTGGHDIPEEAIRRRYQRGIRNFHELYRPMASSWVVYNNSMSGVPEIIAEGRENRRDIIHQPALWSMFSRECPWK